jgi:uncharacterized damage-inducible protein DinB
MMASKEETIEAIRAAEGRVAASFGGLTQEQLATRVHDPEDTGWTAKQVLAHLAGRAQGYQRVLQQAHGVTPVQPPAGFNVDEWNQQRVNERIEKGLPELLAEFRQVHDGLIAQVEAMSDELLNKQVVRPQGEMPLGEALILIGSRHSINHTETVERALGIEAPVSG